jgi:hypothetical protein
VLIQKKEQSRSFSERLRIKFKSELRRRHWFVDKKNK